MTKRVVPLAAVGLVYVATAVGLVHFLGHSYRRDLRERRAAWTLSQVKKAPAPAPPPVETIASVTRPEPSVPVTRHEAPTPRKVHPKPTPAKHLAATPAPSEPIPKPYESPIKLKPLVIPGLETAPTAEEAMFGDALNKLILINHPAVDDGGALQKTLLDAVQPMLDLRTRKDVEIKLVVLDSEGVNAFSHLGGYLYVTRGLLNFAGTEGEFQFVIGHELAHIDHRDGQALLAEATKTGLVASVGTLQAMYHLIARGYTDAQEFAADDLTIDRMLKLDHTTRECLMYLRKLRRMSEDQNFREGHKAPSTQPDATVQDIDNHLRAAPGAAKRLGRLETRLNATPARPGTIGPPGTGP